MVQPTVEPNIRSYLFAPLGLIPQLMKGRNLLQDKAVAVKR